MLAKKYKLPVAAFLRKKTVGLKNQPYFNLKISFSELNYSRFGVVISKKVSPKAVVRNKIKRIIFDFLRKKHFQEFPGKDILIIIYPDAAKLEKEKLEEKLEIIKQVLNSENRK